MKWALMIHVYLAVLLLLLVAVISTDYSDSYGPTNAEITRALVFQKPSNGWGYQARTEKNLRILIIGGSNSLGNCYSNYFASVMGNQSWHPSFNAHVDIFAIGGCTPRSYIGRRYEFENNKDRKSWPNVILLEFSVNWLEFDTVASDMDAVIQTFKYRYKRARLPYPDFVFLELFSVERLLTTIMGFPNENKLKAITGNAENRMSGLSRGCPACKEFRDVASFYGYPTISYREMMFPSFVRYYLNTNGTFKDHRWKYTYEGTHMTKEGGSLLVDTLMVPFFRDVMAPREELPAEQRSMYGDVDIRMFPPSNRSFQILTLSTLNHNEIFTSSSLVNSIRTPMEYYHVARQRASTGWYTGNECYGSTNSSAMLYVDFTVPSECNSLGNCKVAVEFVHSWNTSHYGFASCDLLASKKHKQPVMLENKFINITYDSDGAKMKHTGPMSTRFDSVMKQGNYTLTCRKLDSRMTCMSGLSVVASVML